MRNETDRVIRGYVAYKIGPSALLLVFGLAVFFGSFLLFGIGKVDALLRLWAW